MADIDGLIARREELITQVNTFQDNLTLLRAELATCDEAIRNKLAQLCEPSKVPECLTVIPLAGEPEMLDDVALASTPTSLQSSLRPTVLPGRSWPEAERRAVRRRKGNPVAVLLSNAQAVSPTHQGWVIDRSQSGICLLVDEGVPVGTILSVCSAKTTSRERWVRAEVKSCRHERGSAHLGCQFINKPGWEDLRQFG